MRKNTNAKQFRFQNTILILNHIDIITCHFCSTRNRYTEAFDDINCLFAFVSLFTQTQPKSNYMIIIFYKLPELITKLMD